MPGLQRPIRPEEAWFPLWFTEMTLPVVVPIVAQLLVHRHGARFKDKVIR